MKKNKLSDYIGEWCVGNGWKQTENGFNGTYAYEKNTNYNWMDRIGFTIEEDKVRLCVSSYRIKNDPDEESVEVFFSGAFSNVEDFNCIMRCVEL